MRLASLAPKRLTPGGLLPILLTLSLAYHHVDAHLSSDELEMQQIELREDLQKVLRIRRQTDQSNHHKTPPLYMVKLYNTVADSTGVTRRQNPYNADVVRSFVERDTSLSHLYLFNVTELEAGESVLDAELHLYRIKTPTKMHSTTHGSFYYKIRVYQVLEDVSLATPKLHKLVTWRDVGAHASGWQVFNVKEAVLSWMSGKPNLGLLVTVWNWLEQQVHVEFHRRNQNHRTQPILVLFDEDSSTNNEIDENDYQQESDKEGYIIDALNEHDTDHLKRHQRQRGDLEVANLKANENEAEYFQRQKRRHESDEENASLDMNRRRRRETRALPRKGRRQMKRNGLGSPPKSIDIYEDATSRGKLPKTKREPSAQSKVKHRVQRALNKPIYVDEAIDGKTYSRLLFANDCKRYDLYVNFSSIGMENSIIAPLGYSAYHCKGLCESPLLQEVYPSNHATVQSIVHTKRLRDDVAMPCCVPIRLLSTTLLFYEGDEAVLRTYDDMIADRCGCR